MIYTLKIQLPTLISVLKVANLKKFTPHLLLKNYEYTLFLDGKGMLL
jgi:hypothetical protein